VFQLLDGRRVESVTAAAVRKIYHTLALRQTWLYRVVRHIKREGIMDIGARLYGLRQASGESLQAVADAVGVSKAHVWELEKGRSRNPSFDLVRKLAKHYGVSVDVIAGDEDQPDAKEIKVERIHRDLDELSDRDRAVVEDMIRFSSNGSPRPP
jgi:transcriptional regulator with XRE-family HTH domain